MTPEQGQVDTRFLRIVLWVHWAMLLLAIAVSGLQAESTERVLAASVAAGAYVVALQAIRSAAVERWWIELLTVAGAAAALTAVGLTEGVDSPFLLFSLAPTVLGAGLLSRRVGFQLALISAAGLVIVATVLDQGLVSGSLLVTAGLHFVVAAALPYGMTAFSAGPLDSRSALR